MFNYRLGNILKGVSCACVIASACGMEKVDPLEKFETGGFLAAEQLLKKH